jgi:gliding motility-associated-like protein
VGLLKENQLFKSELQTFFKGFCATVFLLCFSFFSYAQLTVNNTQTPTQLVQDVLLGNGITVSNISYTGASAARGFFNGATSNIGLASGVILTTGDIINAPGPNSSGGEGTDNSGFGDPDLDQISGVFTFDACVLEFDFVPLADSVTFRYVFGSEEYPEFVGGVVNDAFGFFISGPGIAGPYSNGAENIAIIPGTSTPVTINDVNNGDNDCFSGGPTGPCSNCAYYVNNCTGNTVQYDGFTTVLEAKATVIPCQTYHIKLAVADGGDGVWDSGVFLEANSFSSGTVNISAEATYSSTLNDTALIEGCGDALIHFERTGSTTSPQTVHYTITGTATNGTDYVQIPDSIVIPAGQTNVSLTLSSISDGNPEGSETVIITLQLGSVCNGAPQPSIALTISDAPPLNLISVSNDTVLVCPGAVNLSITVNGGIPGYNYSWDSGQTTQTITVNPAVTTTYTVMVSDTCGNQSITESITVSLPNYVPMVITASDAAICGGDSALITATVTGGIPSYTYTWDNGLGDGQTFYVNPAQNTNYTITVTDSCSLSATQTILVSVDTAHADFTYEYQGARTLRFFNTSIDAVDSQWFFQDGTASTDFSPIHTFTDTGTYYVLLVITNSAGCIDSVIYPVIAYPDFHVWIPSGFTPGNDRLNEYFAPVGQGWRSAEMRIFNRWGEQIYTTFDTRLYWDGKRLDGTFYTNDVYVYTMMFKTPIGEVHKRMGTITLVR